MENTIVENNEEVNTGTGMVIDIISNTEVSSIIVVLIAIATGISIVLLRKLVKSTKTKLDDKLLESALKGVDEALHKDKKVKKTNKR